MSVVVKFHGGQENKRSSSRRNSNEEKVEKYWHRDMALFQFHIYETRLDFQINSTSEFNFFYLVELNGVITPLDDMMVC